MCRCVELKRKDISPGHVNMVFNSLFLASFHDLWPVLKADLTSFVLFILCVFFVSASSRLGHEQTSIHPNPYHGSAIRRPVIVCLMETNPCPLPSWTPYANRAKRLRQTLKSTTTSSCDSKVRRLNTTLISALTRESKKPKKRSWGGRRRICGLMIERFKSNGFKRVALIKQILLLGCASNITLETCI